LDFTPPPICINHETMSMQGAKVDEEEAGGADDRALLLMLYLTKRPSLVRMFAAKLGAAAAAEDLVQDIYLRITALKPGDIGNPMGLLYQIGANLMLDRLRAGARGAARETAWRDISRHAVGGEDVADEPAADEAIVSRERLAAAVAAIDALPPRMRQAFRLRRVEGYSQAETAQIMGVSVKAVEKHMGAALKILTETLR
jgi:RNA polymerase sigma-70 factor (ECF subfamily)